ncbi:Bardet-Biedl syndrome 12 protein homolog [Xenopus laevis]|uniref:Chaperonin-containing T-complex member BBS12 n=1 Tax=Xenopus laevis TaxID=8355 RepID=BBS12_XENLA|nr:Bardet-Biedl syndrome 12 protein homolog [Xenopus laevis]A5PKN5.1 RecName: Full=Bardet-Biedl syndrome 12 protein homolog [Xenopus laevis]AAI42556.1 LOC100101288 protein [Xenopus laevis]
MAIRGHKGLQQLLSMATSVNSFLGPMKSYKFIFDQITHESILTSSSFRLLENLDLTSAIGQLLNETIQAHHKSYKTGTTTLFFMVGAWSSAVQECLHLGIPVSLIVSVMLDGLNSCIGHVHSLQVSLVSQVTSDCTNIKTNGINHSNYSASGDQGNCSSELENNPLPRVSNMRTASEFPVAFHKKPLPLCTGTNLYKTQRRRLFHSRHLAEDLSFFQDVPERPQTTTLNNETLDGLAKGLAHGYQPVMNLVKNAVCLHCAEIKENSLDKSSFNISRLETCSLPGLSEEHTTVSFGYTTLVPTESAAVITHLNGKPLRILLVDGELTESHRHLGFDNPDNVKMVFEHAGNEKHNLEDSWISRAYEKIIQANINLILVRGDVCPFLLKQCIHRNILIVTQVKQNILQAFSECTGAEPVTYLTQINCCSVGNEAFVTLCTRANSIIEVSQKIVISITAKKLNLITATLSSRIPSTMQSIEDQFLTCAYRLHHALQEGNVFYGGGAIELLCIHHLQKLVQESSSSFYAYDNAQFHCLSSWMTESATFYRAAIIGCLAKGWYKYISVLLCNMGGFLSELDAVTFIENELQNISHHSSPIDYVRDQYSKKDLFNDEMGISISHHSLPVYDNVTPKLEAWRRALHLVLTVLQTDAEVITNSATQNQILMSETSNGEYLFL